MNPPPSALQPYFTPPFKVSAPLGWDISYAYDCRNLVGDDDSSDLDPPNVELFSVTLYNTDLHGSAGMVGNIIVYAKPTVDMARSDTFFVMGPGNYQLEVDSECVWMIKVVTAP
jgi:hypothetical protein